MENTLYSNFKKLFFGLLLFPLPFKHPHHYDQAKKLHLFPAVTSTHV
jgi:hypothetical protein